MAEDEIRKHAKALYHTLMDKEKNWQHKLKDILVEILIIVFAVTISIWFHNWSDKLQEHKEEKSFLTQLKEDLKGDTASLNSSLEFYEFGLNGMKYLEKVGAGDSLNHDSSGKYNELFFSSTRLQAHISRYEALKGSGKFNIIEDKQLLTNIIDLHESEITHIENLNNFYIQYIQRVASIITEHAQLNKSGQLTNEQDILRMAQMRLLLAYGRDFIADNAIHAHEKCIQKCNELTDEINKFLNK